MSGTGNGSVTAEKRLSLLKAQSNYTSNGKAAVGVANKPKVATGQKISFADEHGNMLAEVSRLHGHGCISLALHGTALSWYEISFTRTNPLSFPPPPSSIRTTLWTACTTQQIAPK